MWRRRPGKNRQSELDDLVTRAGARHDNADQRASRDEAEAGLLRYLVDATLRLEGLTKGLIGLTTVLAVLTAVLALGEADRVRENGRFVVRALGSSTGAWPLASLLDVISAGFVAYGGWVAVSALVRRRPQDLARLASRIVFGGVNVADVSYEFDEADVWKYARESADAKVGTRFLIAGAAGSILGRVLPQGGVLDALWLAVGLTVVVVSVGLTTWGQRRYLPRLVSQSFLSWLESLTSGPAQPVALGNLSNEVFALAWQQNFGPLKSLVQRENGPNWTPHEGFSYAPVERAARILGQACGWHPDKPAWRVWLRG